MNDAYRPRLHYTPRRNWMNDPNGLCWFEGEYHLFYQYNPFGDVWGHMSWGHAVSQDLVHWTELGVAIPERGPEMVFSGSVVVDLENRSGFARPGQPAPMIAIYTGHFEGPPRREVQCLAISHDRGRTFARYENNPVLDLGLADFRDPKVFWHEGAARFVMVAAFSTEEKVGFFGSDDLKSWEPLSQYGPDGLAGELWECPDLVALAAPGGGFKWMLKVDVFKGGVNGGSTGFYRLGGFDGEQFIPDLGGAWTPLDYGADFYASASFAHLPEEKAPILIGWMSNHAYGAELPTAPWRGAMSLARRLELVEASGGLRVAQIPVESGVFDAPQTVSLSHGLALEGAPFKLSLTFSPADRQDLALTLDWTSGDRVRLGYDGARHALYFDRSEAGFLTDRDDYAAKRYAPLSGRPGASLDLDILVDACSVEMFCQGGTAALTHVVFPRGALYRLTLAPGLVPSASRLAGPIAGIAAGDRQGP